MIKFIYFDVGGVLIKDFSGTDKWHEMKKFLRVDPSQDENFENLYDSYSRERNLNLPVDKLKPEFSKKLGIKFLKNFSWLDYFVDNFEQNKSIWPIIKKAKKKYKVGLLTNMYVGMLDKILAVNLLPSRKWDVIVDSTKVGFQKPDREIYEIAQEKSGVKKSEIFFVDNDEKNIKVAKEFSWMTFLYDSSNHKDSCKKLSNYLESLKIN